MAVSKPIKAVKKPIKGATKEVKKIIGCYHVSQTANKDGWQVKLANGEKAIKIFKTQKEAYTYAEQLSKNNDRGYVVHKKTGTIRKV